MKLVQILIERTVYTLDRPFSYVYKGNKPIVEGVRVLINFNNQEIVGYVISVEETNKSIYELEDELGFKIEEIIDVIDDKPLLNDELLNLADQISQYYLAPKISVLHAMLPPSLRPKKSSLNSPKIAYDQYLEVIDDDEEGLTSKQIDILRYIKKEGRVLKREIKSPSIINKLINLEKLHILYEEKHRLVLENYEKENKPTLTDEQQKVINEFLSSDDFVYLLQGVTGSGKSEVYLSLSEEILKKGKSVLMLVPEISLTPMMCKYFIKRFNKDVALLHSELTPAEKYDEYRKIAKGEAKIVVGVRSAIFAPLENIGLIILDEEHVESYKQDTAPFYHARDIAIMRSKFHNAKVLLGSATPSLDSRARADKGVYHLLKLTNRINKQKLPLTTVVNMRDYSNISRESYIFSLKLRQSLQKVLDNKEQAILLINRRGFSTHVSCRSCGFVYKCPNCGIALTYHKDENLLKCHHCNHIQLMNDYCPECGSKYLLKTGFGTERIEHEVKRLFPNARTLRMDSDTTRARTKVSKIVNEFANGDADILIGTQMIAKGHDFSNVTLVGIVLADIGLNMPSFRSSERVFQLITQAVGRSGRSVKTGEAIIQTYSPNHYAITLGARQDYERFYIKEMSMRKLQNYPPYCFLASVTISSKDEELAIKTAFAICDHLNASCQDKILVLGPITPYINYENNTFKRSILIKYKKREDVFPELDNLLTALKNKSRINIAVNIDPFDF